MKNLKRRIHKIITVKKENLMSTMYLTRVSIELIEL